MTEVTTYYYKKEFTFEKGLLDESVDMTYILHLEGNGRLPSIEKELERFHPTKKVILLFNKGYKSGKSLPILSPPYDLVDAYLYAFKDAEEKKYGNILILEDDFLFGENILDKVCTDRINEFLKKKEKKKWMYCLGCLPFIQLPILGDYFNRRLLLKRGTHASIYSLEARNYILKTDQKSIFDWDIYTNLYITTYMYCEPLCYQLFPQTENRKHWFYLFFWNELLDFIQDFWKLDQKVEPGYSFFYWISLLWVFFLLFWILVFIHFFITK
jgi:hypothetical protein